MYTKLNLNPKNKKTGDCVVRACSLALNKSWDTVYKELCDLGYVMKEMPNSDNVWKKFLELNGFVKRSIKVQRGSKRPTVRQLAEASRGKVIVAKVANHVVTIIDGYYYDIFDCGNSSVYVYYEKVI